MTKVTIGAIKPCDAIRLWGMVMVDKRFMNAGIITAVVGGAIIVIAVTTMIYPEETVRRGETEVIQPYFGEGIMVFVVGIMVLFAGVGVYAAGKYKNPPLDSNAPLSGH